MIGVMLAQLAPHYYRADFGPSQAAALFDAFVDDLAEFEVADIQEAVTAYRRDQKNRFFPSSAQLRALTASAVKDRNERQRHKALDRKHPMRRPQFWWLLSHWNEDWAYEDVPHEYRAALDRHLELNGKPRVYRPEAPVERRPYWA